MIALTGGPVLETERLILRQPQAGDLDAYLAFGLTERTRYVGGPRERHTNIEKFCGLIGHWVLRGFGRFVIVDRASGRGIGHCGPFQFDLSDERELSWTLWDGAAEGNGLASEAVLAMRDWLVRDLGWRSAVTSIHRENLASMAIARKIGGHDSGTAAPFLADATTWQFDLTQGMAA